MASINLAVIAGNLGADPEMKVSQSGKAFANLRVAVSGWKDDETQWFDVVAFEQQAEYAGRYLHKGDTVIVQGRNEIRDYVDKDGNKRKAFSIVANSVQGTKTKAADGDIDPKDIPF